VAIESAPQNRLRLAEASILIFGKAGRLEIGERQGLPDVLTGYAPNSFTFTGAEFGPASGPSLDPGGGLQHAFLPAELAEQLNELAVLGATASLADDRSAKLVYVSPKRHGFLAGFSYAPHTDDRRFSHLIQAGLVHERYWASNVLRVGGSFSSARARDGATPAQQSLRSFNAGATLILDDAWMFGLSATWNGASGLARIGPAAADGFGVTASVNYNYGRWTAGAYYQWASAEGDTRIAGNDRLRAAEAGVSYRFTTKLRIYGAVYSFDFNNEGGTRSADRHQGTALLVGIRATL
jgi:predicted porin